MDRFLTGTDIHWTSNRNINTESQKRIHINVFTIQKYLFTALQVPLFRGGLYESSEYIKLFNRCLSIKGVKAGKKVQRIM